MLIIIISAFLNLQAFSWDLDVVNKKNLPNASGNYTEYEFNQSKHFPVTVRTVYIDQSKYRSSIVIQTLQNRQSLIHLSENKKALIAINGGYFRENFLPNGLLVSKGEKISRLVRNRLLDGVVINNANENINLILTENYEAGFSAFQSGPVLFDGSGWASVSQKKKRRRNIILQFDNQNIMLVNMSAVTLFEAVNILKDIIAVNKYEKLRLALNLDGGRSAAFVVNFDDVVMMQENNYIKTAILFVLK